MKFTIHTYGCQMNLHESEKIAGILSEKGFTECGDDNSADVIVFNTCCIRETAEQKIYGHLGTVKKIKENRPEVVVIMCGCMTQQSGVTDYVKRKFPFVNAVLGTQNLSILSEAVDKALLSNVRTFDVSEKFSPDEMVPVKRDSAPNAWVNIIYGCNNFCTYCIVPYVRGREHSRSMQSVLDEVKSLLDAGYKEITLLGQNVNSYGNDRTDGANFAALLNEIGKIPGKFRLRFMTSHPKDLSDEVIDAIAANKNICNCIHLPAQSGSNRILAAMNRKYTREYYLSLLGKLREKIPNVGITTDLMVGFPGETDEDFADTLDLVEKARYSAAFTFVYSRRKGTPAYSMENQIPPEVKRKRITRLIDAQNAVTKEISRSMTGKRYEILVEGVNDRYPNTYCGRTENGRLVNFESDANLTGQFVTVEISASKSATLWGKLW